MFPESLTISKVSNLFCDNINGLAASLLLNVTVLKGKAQTPQKVLYFFVVINAKIYTKRFFFSHRLAIPLGYVAATFCKHYIIRL